MKVQTGYFGPSNQMESFLVKQLTEWWKNKLDNYKVWSSNVDDECPIIEFNDPSYTKNHLSTIFNYKAKATILYGMKNLIISYF